MNYIEEDYTVNITCSGDKYSYFASRETDNSPSKVFLFHHCNAQDHHQSTGHPSRSELFFLATLLSEVKERNI